MIKLACSGCGRRLEILDEASGEKVRCPGCGIVFAISSQPRGERNCPGCAAVYPETTLFCTSCGINLVTGEKISTEETDDRPRGKGSGLKLTLEGAFSGAILGALVLAVMLFIDMAADYFFGISGSEGGALMSRLTGRVVTGLVWGSIVGVATAVTRSSKAGIMAGIVLFALAVFFRFRSVLGSSGGLIIMIASLTFSGFIVYVASLAVAKGVLAGIKWEKYG